MIEIVEEKIDDSTVRISKRNVTYFKKKELEDMKLRMEKELAKVNSMLTTLNA